MIGPGGHSWADFGKPNPVHAMCSALHKFTTAGFAKRSGTSFNVGVLQGGISVNAIPSDAVAEVDLRSVNSNNLDEMEMHLRNLVGDVCNSGSLEWRIECMGERPAGKTPSQSPLVQAAQEVTRRFGVDPQLDVGSTDANIPISLGIPAIALGAGGVSGGVHTVGEWFDPTTRIVALQRLLALTAVLAGLKN
jgi:acetylornithine deacetylase/succinyl-diaminopimelate desuccinylase-like protein